MFSSQSISDRDVHTFDRGAYPSMHSVHISLFCTAQFSIGSKYSTH